MKWIILSLFLLPGFVFAQSSYLPLARVFYKPSGEVIVNWFVSSACRKGETALQCMDRIALKFPHKDLPYDDVPLNQVPEWGTQLKWRGAKGQGVWVDNSIVLSSEIYGEIQNEIKTELLTKKPNLIKIAALKGLQEQLAALRIVSLSSEQLSYFRNQVAPYKYSSSSMPVFGVLNDNIATSTISGFGNIGIILGAFGAIIISLIAGWYFKLRK